MTVDDLFEAAGDAAAMHDSNDAVEGAGMFDKVEINNMDPHAISDARIGDEPAAAASAAQHAAVTGAAAAASSAAAVAVAAGMTPESVKRAAAAPSPPQGVGNPEELDIGDDWDDGG